MPEQNPQQVYVGGPLPARITVVENVYHSRNGKDPTSVTVRFNRILKTNTQPYQRELSIGPDWVELDTGWVKEPSMVMLGVIEKGTLHVGIRVADSVEEFATVPALESVRISPSRPLFLRSLGNPEQVEVVITVYPK